MSQQVEQIIFMHGPWKVHQSTRSLQEIKGARVAKLVEKDILEGRMQSSLSGHAVDELGVRHEINKSQAPIIRCTKTAIEINIQKMMKVVTGT
jgi:hypothetical protein